MAENDEKLIGALIFDEVAIQKHLRFVDYKMLGFENVPIKDAKDANIAQESLVYLFVGINADIQLPVAYYYANNLNGESKSMITKHVYLSLLKAGVIVTSATFGGARENPAMFEILGAKLDVLSESFDPSFIVNGSIIRIIYGPLTQATISS